MQTDSAVRRRHGRFYTPDTIARFMLDRCLDDQPAGETYVLDPACGDGVFLQAAADRNDLRLYGVDNDPDAIDAIRSRWIDSGSAPHALCGDALTGRGFEDDVADFPTSGIDFATEFPEIAAARGFDLVIGNPPYRRELDSKEQFDAVAETPLGKRWRQARMDYWFYFLHRGLDLLKPGGRLSFIVNAYWTASAGARKLIDRLERETTFEEVVLLGDAAVFEGVRGRHLIFRLRKNHSSDSARTMAFQGRRGATSTALEGHRTEGRDTGGAIDPTDVDDEPCRVVDLSACRTLDAIGTALNDLRSAPTWLVERRDLFSNGRLVFEPTTELPPVFAGGETLGDRYEVRQGIAENPPVVTSRMSRESDGRLQVGDGVFVLTSEEVDALELSDHERALLRPYYPVGSLDRDFVPPKPPAWLLYLTRRTAPALDAIPRIAEHLRRFRETLERRREVGRGSIGWWHLHWPREERLFASPRILSLQMGERPRFAFADASQPTYVGFSVNVVCATPGSTWSLPALTEILNSSSAERWFSRHAKRRGVNLEINGGCLREFPLPAFERELDGGQPQLAQCLPLRVRSP